MSVKLNLWLETVELTSKHCFWMSGWWRQEKDHSLGLVFLTLGLVFLLSYLALTLLNQYEEIIYSLHCIINSTTNKSSAIAIIEKECKAGSVIIDYFGDPDDLQFFCKTTKCQNYLGKIRLLSKCKNEHDGLNRFTQLYKSLCDISNPIHMKAAEIDAYIQLQIDIMRGK